MLTALLTFTDLSDEYHTKTTSATPAPNSARPSPPVLTSAPRLASPMSPSNVPPPPVPAKSALDRIVMAQAQQDVRVLIRTSTLIHVYTDGSE